MKHTNEKADNILKLQQKIREGFQSLLITLMCLFCYALLFGSETWIFCSISIIFTLHKYPSELQLNEHNPLGTEAPSLDFNISIRNDIVSTKIYDKQDDSDIENCSFLNGNIPQRPS